MKHKKIVYIILLSFILTGFYVWNRENRTVAEDLNAQSLITVQPAYRSSDKISFDLEKESFFSVRLKWAVRNGKSYQGYKHIKDNGLAEFRDMKKYMLYYPLIATRVKKKTIRENNFKVRQKVNNGMQKTLKKARPYLSSNEIIVIYNKDYLPIEIQLYDTVDKKWTMFARYSYPYKNRKEYEKELNECIEAVLNGDFGED